MNAAGAAARPTAFAPPSIFVIYLGSSTQSH
jgi:hypothetical protein